MIASLVPKGTCAVTELLWRGLNEGPNDLEALKHRLGVIPLAQQRRHIPQLQRVALLLKVCTAHRLTAILCA